MVNSGLPSRAGEEGVAGFEDDPSDLSSLYNLLPLSLGRTCD